MDTPVDSSDDLAEPQFEQKFLKSGRLTRTQFDNRLLLRTIMTKTGFTTIPRECWNFSSAPIGDVRDRYPKTE